MKGRKPKPTQLKVLHGNPGKRPLPKSEPPKIVSDEPVEFLLGDIGEKEAARMRRMLDEMGMGSAAFETAVVCYASVFQDYMAARQLYKRAGESPISKTTNGNIVQHPLLSVINRMRDDMRKWLVEFGMTPSASTRVESTSAENDPASKYVC